MRRIITLALAVTALFAAVPATSSALMHAGPGEHWKNCGYVLGHHVGVIQPGTSCALGRNAARVALTMRHPSSYPGDLNYGPAFRLRAYSSVTHEHYRLRASSSYN